METISNKIVSASVKKEVEQSQQEVTIERPDTLQATTYKMKSLEQTFYITIADMETPTGIRPYEMFINTKSIDHFPYLVCITRLISAFLRTGHEYNFIAKELQQIHDPKEGNYFKKGKSYPSLIAEIGHILEKHFLTIEEKNKNIL